MNSCVQQGEKGDNSYNLGKEEAGGGGLSVVGKSPGN
jgi:hypothetical protein